MLSAASILTLTLAIAQGPQATPPEPAPRGEPFTRLFQNLVHDIRALPSADTALVLAVGGGSAIVLHPVDDNLAGWIQKHGDSRYTSLGRFAGDGWVQGGLAVGTYFIGLAAHDRETEHVGSDLIRGQFLVALTTRALKIAFDRSRPSGGGHSFPSGHSSAAFLSAAVIDGHYGWKAGLAAYATAGFISWTRIRENEHWLTDVVGGGTLGVIIGRTVTAHRDRPWVVAPSVTAGGVALYVVRR